ncbi:hypothetical protein J8I26_05045 [Herbaspirillum sp. LeCh32-8]|uniref:hypothetical protein n=1 Tax=Herbaspirillum sp. LeCh32-8 TaxID=2821356 RepID=UPI001AE5D73B|nr:hypothetical protein [Herbaspirillum sp. LeCh32-8]MBP0597459.1 hypothetical protein [Herbaspirillum sp. LeCh32-8]
MSIIIAGQFQLQDQAAQAVDSLVDAGYARAGISSFFVNPAGQHDTFPVGGDRNKSPGAEDTDKGAVAGAATGAAAGVAVGAVTAPVTGPAGPALGGLVGGHLGSLVGTLGATDDGIHRRRAAGMLVAVEVADGEQEQRAIALLQELQADTIERNEGHIRNGDWEDFDPLAPPVLVAA